MGKVPKINILKLLHLYATCSSIAYEDDKKARELFSEMKIEHSMFLSGVSTQIYVGKDSEGKTIISIRGTEGDCAADLVADIRFKKVPYKVGMTHEGFKLALEEVYPCLVAHLKTIATKESEVVINGHSLGGALAVLCGIRLKLEEGYKNVTLYTFGQPKVGDKEFIDELEKHFKDKYFRVVNDEDVVPKLPTYWKMNFDHNDTVYFINDDPIVQKQPEGYDLVANALEYASDFFKELSSDNTDFERLFKTNGKELVDDHSIFQYISQLSIAIEKLEEIEKNKVNENDSQA